MSHEACSAAVLHSESSWYQEGLAQGMLAVDIIEDEEGEDKGQKRSLNLLLRHGCCLFGHLLI
jgi:hypothetical protein